MRYLAKLTHGFSGADLAALCQCAGMLAIRQWIEAEQWFKREDVQAANRYMEFEDLSREITRANFEKAVKKYRRRPISDDDIRKYEMFSQTLQRSTEFSRYILVEPTPAI